MKTIKKYIDIIFVSVIIIVAAYSYFLLLNGFYRINLMLKELYDLNIIVHLILILYGTILFPCLLCFAISLIFSYYSYPHQDDSLLQIMKSHLYYQKKERSAIALSEVILLLSFFVIVPLFTSENVLFIFVLVVLLIMLFLFFAQIKILFNDYKKNLVLNLMVDFALLLLYTELPFWGIIFTTTRTSIF